MQKKEKKDYNLKISTVFSRSGKWPQAGRNGGGRKKGSCIFDAARINDGNLAILSMQPEKPPPKKKLSFNSNIHFHHILSTTTLFVMYSFIQIQRLDEKLRNRSQLYRWSRCYESPVGTLRSVSPNKGPSCDQSFSNPSCQPIFHS